MGSADKNDAQVGNYLCMRTSWPKGFLDFKLEIINLMLTRCINSLDTTKVKAEGKHYPKDVPPTAKKKKAQKWCVICKRNGN